MAKDDGAGLILGAGAIALLFAWWNKRQGGGPVSSGQKSKPGCGCNGTAGNTMKTVNPQPVRKPISSTVSTTATPQSGAGAPPAAPGGNRRGAGSGAQWTGAKAPSGTLTPGSAPSSPNTPVGSSVYMGNTTVVGVGS